MFWSIREACCCTASSPPPTFRIATAVRAAGDLVRSVSLSREIVRRQRLSGPGLSPRPGRHPARSRDRDAKRRSGEGLRRPAQALGGRTHHRLAQPLPPTGQLDLEPQPPALAFIKLASIRLMISLLWPFQTHAPTLFLQAGRLAKVYSVVSSRRQNPHLF